MGKKHLQKMLNLKKKLKIRIVFCLKLAFNIFEPVFNKFGISIKVCGFTILILISLQEMFFGLYCISIFCKYWMHMLKIGIFSDILQKIKKKSYCFANIYLSPFEPQTPSKLQKV